MTLFDTLIYFLFFLRFSSIFFGIIISYHKKIISNDDTSSENVKEIEHHKEKVVRNGKIKKVLSFEIKKTEREAILEAEKWLSEKITEDYFNEVNESEDLTYEQYKNLTRGSILSSAIFIESIGKLNDNHIHLFCGS